LVSIAKYQYYQALDSLYPVWQRGWTLTEERESSISCIRQGRIQNFFKEGVQG
jgi:hypothetical protein